jgi:hypothetical protein
VATQNLGEGLTGTISVPGGEARLYERGATITSNVGDVVVAFDLPPIGIPVIATGDAAQAAVLEPTAITFQILGWQRDAFVAALSALFAERVALLPTGKPPKPVPLVLGTPIVVAPARSGVQETYGVSASAALEERQLYDIAVRGDDGVWHAIAPHALYYRAGWHDFGIVHLTDVHLARRIDYFPGRLETAGRTAAATMSNWNDRFRGFVKYANYLHGQGVVDLILATGDIIDFLFEDDDDPSGGGNALFARELILGRVPGVAVPEVEELRVPMFVVPGNHDYRVWPYKLLFTLDTGPIEVREWSSVFDWDVKEFGQFTNYKMDRGDALVAMGGQLDDDPPSLSGDTASLPIQIDRDIGPFRAQLADRWHPDRQDFQNPLQDELNYVIRLGDHRIVMLDSAHDVGLPVNATEAVLYALGAVAEDKSTAAGGSPNSLGVTEKMIKAVVDTLAETPDGGLFIVGIHAPLFNLWAEEYPYFLRETQRTAQKKQVYRWLGRHDDESRESESKARSRHPLWFGPAGDPDAVPYVKRGDPSDLLDFGVSRGGSDDLLKAIAGVGQGRAADLVLQGHIHRHNEFRIGAAGDELAFYFDFYTQNFPRYYPTRFVKMWHESYHGDLPGQYVTYVDVVDDAPANNEPSELPFEDAYTHVVSVPPYPKPLSAAPDARAWWAEHRPLVMQGEALGPFKNAYANLAGFRVISVTGDVIERIHTVSIEKLHAANYQIDWQQLIAPEGPRALLHSQRSREFGMPPAAGDPCMFSLPPAADQTIVYRDGEGRLFEIWRKAGERGGGNLTDAGQAPKAAGDPSCYLDTTAGLVVVPYRGVNDEIHSLYWSTGAVGHDALSGSVNAPKAVGDPVGYYNVATQTHSVFYRGDNGHLHSLSWQGQGAVLHEDLVGGANAIAAQGDPAAYLDTTRNRNVVVYRAVDGYVRSIYWSDGPSGMDDLSGYAHTPHADGDPAACYVARHDAHYVVYRAADGHIYLLQWTGEQPVGGVDLTATANAPLAGGEPRIWDNAAADRHHVVYRGVDGHVHDLSWMPSLALTPTHRDLSVEAWSPPAAGDPFGFDGETYQHVIYRGKDEHIHEIRWTVEPVDAPQSVSGRLLFYRDHTRDGTGDVSSPSVIGLGGWQAFKFLFSGGDGSIYAVDDAGQLLFYRDSTRDGTGDVSSPSVIGLGGWQAFKFLFSGGDGIIYAVVG